MEILNKKIVDFIKQHHVFTLATSNNNEPWCCNCFYAYIKEDNMLVFTSDYETRHIKEGLKNDRVSGSIVLETGIIGKIQGIQFSGTLFEPRDDMYKQANSAYIKRFPFARLMDTTLWVIEVKYIKMTDNRLGFGKKLIWEKDAI